MENWYVAKSKPQKETVLMTNLANLGVEVFFPRIVVQKRRNEVMEPLFPTYIFCKFDPHYHKWPAIRWAGGLSYFLSADDAPTRVPEDLVDYLKLRVAAWNTQDYRGRQFSPGDRVRVHEGPFSGLEGVFSRYTNSQSRCQILLEVLGRLTSVEIDEGGLSVAGQAPLYRLAFQQG